MASLEEFENTTPTSLQDFKQEEKKEATNKSSIANLAANVSLLGDANELETNFRTTSAEMSSDGTSPTAQVLMEDAKTRGYERAKDGVVDILSDPNLSDEDKQDITDQYMSDLGYRGVMDLVGEEALVADSDPTDTDEMEFIRGNTAAALSEMNDHKKDMQALLNREALIREGGSVADTIVDFMELFVPFTESNQATKVLNDLKTATGDDRKKGIIEGLTFLGNTKGDIKNLVRKMPPEKRLEFGQMLADIVRNNDSILLSDSNDFASMDLLQTALDVGSYGGVEQAVDNITSVLDVIGIGGLVKAVTRSSKARKIGKAVADSTGVTKVVEDIEEVISAQTKSNAVRRGTRSPVSPVSPSQNLKDTNPSKARAAHEIASADETGEAAKALYGTSRVEAIANDLLPEASELLNTVKNKVSNADQFYKRGITPDPELMDFVHNDGALWAWKPEKIQARADVVNDFKNATGLTTRDEMFSAKTTQTGGLQIKAIYTPTQGGFKDPQEAIEHVKFALRDRGITDDAITLYARRGEDYEVTTLKELEANKVVADEFRRKKKRIPSEIKEPIDYMVGVGHNYDFDVADVTMSGKLDTRFNVFDRSRALVGDTQGSVQRHLLDPASFLDPKLVLPANVAVDRAAGLEKELTDLGKAFSKGFAALKNDRRNAVTEFIKRANSEGLPTTPTSVKAAGFNEVERAVLSMWRTVWDTVYWLENKDLSRTLKATGYKAYKNGGTELFVRPVGKNQLGGKVKVYDSETDSLISLNSNDLAALYEGGGTIAKIRQPVKVGDDVGEFISVANTETSGYLRTLNDNDMVLNYREGYYQVHYKDPKFIVKVEKDSRGNVLYERTVATAGNTSDAEHTVKRLTATDGGEYYHRKDKKSNAFDNDDAWDVQVSSGRTAQRIRGKRLEDSTSPVTDTSHEHILDPIEALTKSVRSVSRRASMRSYLEASKSRMITQFGEMFPKDKLGQPSWPNSIKEIKTRSGDDAGKELADARSNYEYINYLENGYINAIDETSKALLNTLGDFLGSKGLSKLEGTANKAASGTGPSGFMKSLSFNLYLASNPLRQIIVQSHQAVQLFATFNPKYIANSSTKSLVLMSKLRGADKTPQSLLKASGLTQSQADELFKEYKRSGLHAAVDVNNIVRGDLSNLAETSFLGKARQTVTAPLTLARRIGFDAGEQANMMTAWLVHREKATDGVHRVLSSEEADTVTGLARNFTYNMNSAGDMPYNQNSLNVVMQFLQVPHKALTTTTFNRVLSTEDKLKLIAFNTVFYGVPVGTAGVLLKQILPDDPVIRDTIEYGLETVLLNKLISLATGTDSRIDFTNLAPNDVLGFSDTLVEILTMPEGLGGLIAGSPSGQLLFGNNPKITAAFKTAARYFNITDDYEDPTTFSDVATDFAKLSSGFSNGFKAMYAWQYGQKISTSGAISDSSVTKPEAIAQLFGFGTLDEATTYKIKDKLYSESSAYRDDVTSWYNELKRTLAKKNVSTQEAEYTSRVMSEAWRVFSNADDIKAKEIVNSLIKKDAKNNDAGLINSIISNMGWMDEATTRELILSLPDNGDGKKKLLLETLDGVSRYKDE